MLGSSPPGADYNCSHNAK